MPEANKEKPRRISPRPLTWTAPGAALRAFRSPHEASAGYRPGDANPRDGSGGLASDRKLARQD